jgi:hypothetical protein
MSRAFSFETHQNPSFGTQATLAGRALLFALS